MTSICFAQNSSSITYRVEINKQQHDASILCDYLLQYDNNYSFFTPLVTNPKDKLVSGAESSVLGSLDSIVQVQTKSGIKVRSFLDYHITNLATGEVYFNENLLNKLYDIKDVERKPSWELVSMVKDTVIAGYKCQKAYGDFMGRNYVAYFTTDILTNAAPFKFTGLPGLILSLNSLDNYVRIEVKSISLNKSNDALLTFSKPLKLMSYGEYWDLLRTTYETNAKKAVARMSASKTDDDENSITIEFKDFMEIPMIKPIELKY